jgi:hypothetical protein
MAELMNRREAAYVGVIANEDVSPKGCAVTHNDMIANRTIVRNVSMG